MSKGSNRRPTQVDRKIADANWDAIFGSKSTAAPKDKGDCQNCGDCTCGKKQQTDLPSGN